MKSPLPLSVAAASFLLLAACNSKPATPEVLDSNPDPMANVLANAAPVELPPAIKADVSFRCTDNSLVSVTFFQGDKQANIRTVKGGTPTRVTAAEAGAPLTAEGGWSLTGDEKHIVLKQPGKGELTCHV